MAFIDQFPYGKELLSIERAAQRLGVSRRTIYNWINSNKVDYCRTASGSIRIIADTLFSHTNTPVRRLHG